MNYVMTLVFVTLTSFACTDPKAFPIAVFCGLVSIGGFIRQGVDYYFLTLDKREKAQQ